MNQRLPPVYVAKYKRHMAKEYDLDFYQFSKKLKEANIIIPRGIILRREQEMVYSALGPPVFVYITRIKKIRFHPKPKKK